MTAIFLRLADHRRAIPATTTARTLGQVVPFVRRETTAGRAKGDLLASQRALERAAARLAAAEARSAAPAEVAFLRRLWRTARIDAVLASARHGGAHLRAA